VTGAYAIKIIIIIITIIIIIIIIITIIIITIIIIKKGLVIFGLVKNIEWNMLNIQRLLKKRDILAGINLSNLLNFFHCQILTTHIGKCCNDWR